MVLQWRDGRVLAGEGVGSSCVNSVGDIGELLDGLLLASSEVEEVNLHLVSTTAVKETSARLLPTTETQQTASAPAPDKKTQEASSDPLHESHSKGRTSGTTK